MKAIFVSLCLLMVLTASVPVPVVNSENGNRFAFSMMNVLMKQNKNLNFVYSPYGVRNCFAYVYPGADSTTKREIQNVFHFGNTPEEELSTFKKSNHEFSLCTESKTKIANSLWIRETAAPIKPEYLKLTKKYTNSVNVLKDAAQVNQWVSLNTTGEIPELVSDAEIRPVPVLLLNAITLNAKWKFPFDPNTTKDKDFFSPQTKSKVPTMSSEVGGLFFKDKTVQIAQLAYTDLLSMTLVMPLVENYSFQWDENMQRRLLADKNPQHIQGVWTDIYPRYVEMPKFKMNSTINMIPALETQGIKDAFSELDADFTKINHSLYIGLVKQKAMLEITEYGTKAAAATTVGFYERGMTDTDKFDHPFYFMIHHVKTGEILFMGRMVDPLQK